MKNHHITGGKNFRIDGTLSHPVQISVIPQYRSSAGFPIIYFKLVIVQIIDVHNCRSIVPEWPEGTPNIERPLSGRIYMWKDRYRVHL